MNTHHTAVLKQGGEWWIGWIEELPGVNCQESSRDALLKSLPVTLREALEFNHSDAIDAALSENWHGARLRCLARERLYLPAIQNCVPNQPGSEPSQMGKSRPRNWPGTCTETD